MARENVITEVYLALLTGAIYGEVYIDLYGNYLTRFFLLK